MIVVGPELDYVRDAQPIHRALQQSLVQLAAFMLTRVAARRSALIDHAPVEVARDALAEVTQALAALRVPAAAAHHNRHLGAAADALDCAVRAALSSTDADGDALFRALEEAEQHLKAVAKILPGFEPVDFTQACCAAHAGLAGVPSDYPKTKAGGEENGRLFDLGAGLRCG